MPFGLTNAQAMCQSIRTQLLQPFPWKFVIVFFYHILVYSPTLDQHFHHFSVIFSCLARERFYLKFYKCLFAQECMEYLGHIIYLQGIAPDPSMLLCYICQYLRILNNFVEFLFCLDSIDVLRKLCFRCSFYNPTLKKTPFVGIKTPKVLFNL